MLTRILISKSEPLLQQEIVRLLRAFGVKNPHPDLLYFPVGSKLGITEAKKIKEHFSTKPYQAAGKAAVLEDASKLTDEAQNSLLKILEEPPAEAVIIFGANSEANFLPTILSRCEIIHLSEDHEPSENSYEADIRKLLKSTIEQRFEYVEKLKDRDEFFLSLIRYFHQSLNLHPEDTNPDFIKELLQAKQWAGANGNIRAILEYLMLVMPQEL